MKALIVRKQYLDRILDGSKIWEMRTSKTKVRGKISLIESGSGLIVGECEIADSLEAIDTDLENLIITFEKHQVSELHLLEKWKYPWVIKNAKRYDEPKPYKHPKGAVIWVDTTKEGVLV